MNSISNAETMQADTLENKFLTFNIGKENYGIEIRHVLQIIGMQQITRMPEMPPDMQGFITLRGNVIPVTSLRRRFGYDDLGEYSERTCIIVVQLEEDEKDARNAGLIVDMINETLTIDPHSIAEPPVINKSNFDQYVTGIARLEGMQNALLLDVQKLMS